MRHLSLLSKGITFLIALIGLISRLQIHDTL